MRRKQSVAIITYNGLDGACAAAMSLLGFPRARLLISSAAAIGQTLGALTTDRSLPSEIHVCGVGVYGDWNEVAAQARKLAAKGSKLTWYCGRGYLDDRLEDFRAFCEPVFLNVASNTEAVRCHVKVGKHSEAPFLLGLAKRDPAIGLAEEPLTDEQRFWSDLIDASYGEYAKYRDCDRYEVTIRKLARRETDKEDKRLVETFRRTGLRYAMVGRSPQLRHLQELIRKCAPFDDPVLVLGESGVGKEHVVHLLHERGPRSTGPFVAINCAHFAGNVELANSALFGHRKGAFTGAVEDRKGAFQTASGGVLYLDELGLLPVEVQGKLLRVLDDKMVPSEGADEPRHADVQVIAATNRDLPAMVRSGQFLADLFYRLAVLRIEIPPLRERREDIRAIAAAVLDDLKQAGHVYSLKSKDRELLLAYDWPGNVRQLIAVLRRSVYLGLPIALVIEEWRRLGQLTVENQQPQGVEMLPRCAEDVRPIREINRAYAARALQLHNGNLRATARSLGIAVNTLRACLKGR